MHTKLASNWQTKILVINSSLRGITYSQTNLPGLVNMTNSLWTGKWPSRNVVDDYPATFRMVDLSSSIRNRLPGRVIEIIIPSVTINWWDEASSWESWGLGSARLFSRIKNPTNRAPMTRLVEVGFRLSELIPLVTSSGNIYIYNCMYIFI